MSKIQLVKNKNIGKVVFIVEGPKTEVFILKQIVSKIFNYSLVVKRNNRCKVELFKSKSNENSTVYIINAEQSELKHILPGNEYLEDLLNYLIENNELSLENSSIYYIYDRDPLNNVDKELINNLHNNYYNSMDNGIERQGLLLLSYPAMESYTLSNFLCDSFKEKRKLGKEVKCYCDELNFNQSQISEKSIIHATNELIAAIKHFNFSDYDLDNMSVFNSEVFDCQEKNLLNNNSYNLLSLLSIAFLDLGLIEYLQ